jgi:hypothetical protein
LVCRYFINNQNISKCRGLGATVLRGDNYDILYTNFLKSKYIVYNADNFRYISNNRTGEKLWNGGERSSLKRAPFLVFSPYL